MEKINLSDNVNDLTALEGYEEPSSVLVETEGNYLDVDGYHKGVANRVHLRRKVFLKWDTTNGFFKVNDDIVACGPKPPLMVTVLGVNFTWQLWENMHLLCQNQDPGKRHKTSDGRLVQMGEWNENGVISKKECGVCPFNSKLGAKGKKTCKDAMQLVMNILLDGAERTVSLQTSNFQLIGNFDDYLYKLQGMGKRLGDVTLQINRGTAQEFGGKKMFGWDIQKISDKPLQDYATDLFNEKRK